MSEYQTPIGPIFELQRETIKRTVDMLYVPRTLRDDISRDGIATGEHVGTQLLEVGRQTVNQSLALAETVQGDQAEIDELRGTVDSVFDGLLDRHEELYNLVEETYDRTDTEILTHSTEQLQVLLELNRSVEHQLAMAIEELEEQSTRGDELAEEIESQIDRLSEQLERQTERYSELRSELEGTTEVPVIGSDMETSSRNGESETSDPDRESETNSQNREAQTPDGEVRCRVCGETYSAITYSHLQTHDLSVEEYRSEFGEDIPL